MFHAVTNHADTVNKFIDLFVGCVQENLSVGWEKRLSNSSTDLLSHVLHEEPTDLHDVMNTLIDFLDVFPEVLFFLVVNVFHLDDLFSHLSVVFLYKEEDFLQFVNEGSGIFNCEHCLKTFCLVGYEKLEVLGDLL